MRCMRWDCSYDKDDAKPQTRRAGRLMVCRGRVNMDNEYTAQRCVIFDVRGSMELSTDITTHQLN